MAGHELAHALPALPFWDHGNGWMTASCCRPAHACLVERPWRRSLPLACLPCRSWVYDNYVPLITASIVFSAALSLYLYASRWVCVTQ